MNDPKPVAGRIWLRDYPPDVPAEIDPDSIPSLKHLYEDACRRHAPQVAFSNMGATLTYAQVDEMSRRFGAWLQKVAGLGKGERVYSVRFVGDTGYVVTFRQIDPLYTLDLADPARPRVLGELKIPGYSAYLHPVGEDLLLGVGQDATEEGRPTGTQISLFDVSDLRRPARLHTHHLGAGWSEAERDPHAFLYWAPERLVVLPVRQPGVDTGRADGTKHPPSGGVLALRIGDKGFTVAGTVDHPGGLADGGEWAPIRRSLMIDGVLWTVSDAGLKATALSGMTTLAWVPLT